MESASKETAELLRAVEAARGASADLACGSFLLAKSQIGKLLDRTPPADSVFVDWLNSRIREHGKADSLAIALSGMLTTLAGAYAKPRRAHSRAIERYCDRINKHVGTSDDLLVELLHELQGKARRSDVLKFLWSHRNSQVAYGTLAECWPDSATDDTIKKTLQRLEEDVSLFDPTAKRVFLDWSHSGKFAKLVVAEK